MTRERQKYKQVVASAKIYNSHIEQSRNKLKVPVGSKIALHGNGDRNGALLQIVT